MPRVTGRDNDTETIYHRFPTDFSPRRYLRRVASDGVLGRRALLRAGAGIGAAMALPPSTAGCGNSDDDALTFFFQAVPEEAKARLRVIDAFRKLHPDIKIRVLLSGPNPQQQVLTYCAGGKCPDVIMAWELLYAELAELGVFLDLNTMLAADPKYAAALRDDSFPVLYDTFRYRGGQYVLPEQWSGIFVYYNKKLFAEAGLRPPPARWEDAWKFAEFLEAATALTRRDRSGNVTRWGVVDAWVPYYTASCFGMNNGIEWFTPRVDPTRTNIDAGAFAHGFQFYADLVNRHRVAPRSGDQQSINAQDLFARGKAGMAIVGHWMYSAFAGSEGLDFDVTVLPVGPNGRRACSDIGSTGLAIAAASPRREQAWEFVKFATGPVGQAVIARSGLFVPVLKSAVNSTDFARTHSGVRNIEVLSGGPANSHGLPVTPHWSRVDAALRRGSERVLRGAATADWFADGLAADVNRLLSTT